MPPIPNGYHLGEAFDVADGLDVSVYYENFCVFDIWIDFLGAKCVYYSRWVRPIPTPTKFGTWIEYPDLPTLVTSMITKHRLGAI